MVDRVDLDEPLLTTLRVLHFDELPELMMIDV